MILSQNRKAIPQADIVCGTCNTEFKTLALQCHNCTICYHPTCAEMPLYYMGKYARSAIKFQCKQCTKQLVEPHWIDTAHLFRDGYTNSINIKNLQDLNYTDVPTEESRIESEAENTEEMSKERAEEQRSQSNEKDHETHQLDPTSRAATIAATEEPQNEQRRKLLRKINTVCNFYI